MLDKITKICLDNRLILIAASILFIFVGGYVASHMKVDVFPDLTAPTVTIITDVHGMAPEEIEAAVTFPIETALNGATGVRRVRSQSNVGLSTVYVEFDWGTDIYRARQVVNEKLQLVSLSLPAGFVPVLAPISSIMGEIMYIGLLSARHSLMETKEVADFVVRRRLLSIPGVSQVVNIGGETKQYQVNIDSHRLAVYGLSVNQVLEAVKGSNENFSAGVMKSGGQDYLIRGIGRMRSVADLETSAIGLGGGIPILVRDVATVKAGPAFRIGDASVDGKPAVILAIQKHPDTNTVELTKRLETVLAEIKKTLPEGMVIDTDVFRQADFIRRAIENVLRVLVEGGILVFIIIMLFLGNMRATIISVTAIPLSLIFGTLVLKYFDVTINTMTLGGMAIAIGVIVDDAIIYVENVYRRLTENHALPDNARQLPLKVIFRASREIRGPIISATLIIIVVFAPLFFLSGMEGRLLRPLGMSYMISIGASLIVALTVTPAMCAYLLPRGGPTGKNGDSALVRWLKKLYKPLLGFALQKPVLIIVAALCVFVLSLVPLLFMGRSFLPPFNEGSLTIMIAVAPGTSLEKSSEIAALAEQILRNHKNVTKTSRKTGRGELDEHGKAANASEIDTKLDLGKRRLDSVLSELRASMASIPGTIITFGQPISHRIDHMLSGTTANIAVKIFGRELFRLRAIAEDVRSEMSQVEGIADLAIEQQADIPQVRIVPRRSELLKYGLSVSQVAEATEVAMFGKVVSRTLEGDRGFDILVRFDDSAKKDIESVKAVLVDTPGGAKVPLSAVADISSAKGPNSISRENVQRKMVVQANVSGRDLRSVYEDVNSRIEKNLKLPPGYYIEYGGQFKSEAEASRMIGILSLLSLLAIFLILYMEFRSFRLTVLVMVNLPLALIGGIIVIFLTGRVVSIASIVGFITLFGIATRNGILLVSHYRHLMTAEGKSLRDAVFQGSMERLRPVIMTALAAGLALVPFAMAADKPGNEILSPLAIVILGGLLSSMLLNMVVLPSLYLKFGNRGGLQTDVGKEAA
ncbi:MAG: CusA/CzcA family heavy metal efflux RND transporter [Syntrophus sp. (in: bacteria)]|nr:CusA/CzcA family heavy metal efflux RND transporter [Syntrophus sp. (in: bacteria)]